MYDKHECSRAINIYSINMKHAAPESTHDYNIFTHSLTHSPDSFGLSFVSAAVLCDSSKARTPCSRKLHTPNTHIQFSY